MSEFKDPMAGFTFSRTGVLPGPMGAEWKRWDEAEVADFPADVILAIDNTRALEELVEQGSIITETDRIIDGQWEKITASQTKGFKRIYKEAAQLLDITHG